MTSIADTTSASAHGRRGAEAAGLSREAANALLTLGALAAAYYILRDPDRRRLAWRAGRAALLSSLPTYLLQEVGRAWAESAHQPLRMTPSGPVTLGADCTVARSGFWGVP